MRKMVEKLSGKNADESSSAPVKQDSEKGDDEFKEAEDAVEEEREDEEEKFEEAQEQVPDPQAEWEAELQREEDAVKAQLAQLGVEAAAAARAEKDMEEKPMDPTLIPPVAVRPDWENDMSSMRALVEDPQTNDEERIRILHEALMQRIEDTKNLDDHKATTLRRLAEATKERDRLKVETQRALQAQAKLSGSCTELQQQKMTIAKENRRIAEEERSRHTELKSKFEQAIKDVQEKMDAELEVRQHFLKENEDLRGKLQKFTETYEAQEAQLAEQRVSRESEMELAQKRLKEHETMCAESKVKTASLEKHNVDLRKSQTILRAELQSIVGKFDEFHDSVTGSNQRHGECKVEIDTLQEKLQECEKENADLKKAPELAKATEEHKVAEKQRDALERLCDNLVKENKKLQEQINKGKK